MRKIIYTRPDGGLSVVTPIINTHALVDGKLVPQPEDISEEQAIQRALAKLPADAVGVQVIDASLVPTDRTFRNAWKAGTGCIEHDMAKCRELHRNKLREMRKPKLEALDVEYMKALEKNDQVAIAAIVAKKQALRDAPADPAIEAAATPETLKTVIPEALT